VTRKIPESTVGRLSLYLRVLGELEQEGVRTASSEALARRGGTTAAQVRKDLSFFGTFGKRGLGYTVTELRDTLRTILGLQRRWRVAVVGAGRIGGALIGYPDLRRQGFDIRAVFDRDPEKVGRTWSGLVVHELSALERILQSEPIDIAILAVPAAAAQEMAGRVVRAGVRAILNFAPVKLALPPEVAVKNVDMAVELEGLSYALSRGVNGTAAANATAAASGAAGTGGTGGGAA